ncbi:MAG: hypothetical protein MK108_06460 [Mariniblastus sp.]|nr:hypothetical protein [Mariniblastus sp.]
MTVYHQYFFPIFGAGLLLALTLSLAAGWRRGCIVPLICLPLGVLSFWSGLFLGAEIGYRQWQNIPNPPDEAFADTAPLGALLVGWLPGLIFCGAIFGLTRLIYTLVSPRDVTPMNPSSTSANINRAETGNPYQAPGRPEDES